MAFTLTIDGITVKAETAAEAAELVKALRSGGKADAQTPGKQAPASKRTTAARRRARKGVGFMRVADTEVALRFLKTIRDAGATGVEREAVMKAMGVTHPKGVGSRSAEINRLLIDAQVRPGSVYQNPKGPSGRVWKGGRHLNKAIAKLEQRSAAH